MGQLSSRLDYRVRRSSHRAQSPGLPPSIHDISTGQHGAPVVSRTRSKKVQHVRTVGERRLTQDPWDGHKYEWRSEGESWGSPEEVLPADDAGGYETPMCLQPEPSDWRPDDTDSVSTGTDDGDTSTYVKTDVGEQGNAASPNEEFDPGQFLDRVPHTDTEGVVMAPWKRLIVAKQMAENARRKTEALRRKEEEEAKYYELPRWKRALILKTEAELRETRERRLEDELATKPKRLTDPSLLVDDDGLPIPDPLDDEMSLAEDLPAESR